MRYWGSEKQQLGNHLERQSDTKCTWCSQKRTKRRNVKGRNSIDLPALKPFFSLEWGGKQSAICKIYRKLMSWWVDEVVRLVRLWVELILLLYLSHLKLWRTNKDKHLFECKNVMQLANHLNFSYICSVLLHKVRTPHDNASSKIQTQKARVGDEKQFDTSDIHNL